MTFTLDALTDAMSKQPPAATQRLDRVSVEAIA